MLNPEDISTLYNVLRSCFKSPPAKSELQAKVEAIGCAIVNHDLDDTDIEEICRHFESHASIRQEEGYFLESDESRNRAWYNTFEPPECGYWSRFYEWMQSHGKLSNDVLAKLDFNSTQIMKRLGNPKDSSFKVRGLVLGDVQAGKTLNYSALVNKAIDAGYRVIVILSGMLENLRKQTQYRMEESVSGEATREGKNAVTGIRAGEKVGCGILGGRREPPVVAATLREGDFKATFQTKISPNSVLLFVSKKNKSVLSKIHTWLTTCANPDSGTKILHESLLLIDDEADNASINVKKDDTEPTQINRLIRKILASFRKSAYVGFTATPYANIFINPDPPEDDELEDDLFPKDFIHVIPAPENYLGASRIFGPEGDRQGMVRRIEDIYEFLPPDHKDTDDIPDELPESLKRAIRTFIIASAIRDCRVTEDSNIHRTMLVNVSRFIHVQTIVADRIRDFLTHHIVDPICNNLENPRARFVPDIKAMREIYEKEYAAGCGFTWLTVFSKIAEHVGEFIVQVCNSKSKSVLVYPKDKPVRVIVVGGLAVSRGLTLEGLSMTYLSRNTRMYDALMQMGRWFGYRDGYIDVCQLWMSPTSVEWYQTVTKAHMELVADFRRMNDLGRTPADFGLRVRQDDVTLLITAMNKMRNSWQARGKTSLLGTVVEFPLLDRKPKINQANERLVNNLLERLRRHSALRVQEKPSAECYPHVSASFIIDFLERYQIANINSHIIFYQETLSVIRRLSESDGRFNRWTVALVTINRKENGRLGVKRQVEARDGYFRVGKKSAHLAGGRDMGLIGLDETLLQNINKKDFKSERAFYARGIDREPTLILYPMNIELPSEEGWDEWSEDEQLAYRTQKQLVYGLTLGFPDYEGVSSSMGEMELKYRVNAVAMEEMYGASSFVDEHEDDEEDEE